MLINMIIMKKLMMMAVVCCFFVTEGCTTSGETKETEYVRLAINGTDVNLRPQPFASGRILTRTNAGDVFIAEKQPVVSGQDETKWYKIVLAVDPETGEPVKLSQWDALKRSENFLSGAVDPFGLTQWDPRCKATVAFVHADYAIVSPLPEGEREKIMATRTGAGYTSDAVAGSWSYVFSTEGIQETPYFLQEFNLSVPWMDIYDDNTFSARFYETWLEGALTKTGAHAYRCKGAVRAWSEGELYNEESDDVILYDAESGMLRYTVNVADAQDIHHYFAPFDYLYTSSGRQSADRDKVTVSIYDTSDFGNSSLGNRQREQLREMSENGTFRKIHEKAVAALAEKHREWIRSNPDFELIFSTKGDLFINGSNDDHAFILYNKKRAIMTIFVYNESARKYYELYRDIQVEGSSPNYYGTYDYLAGSYIIESYTYLKDNPAYFQDQDNEPWRISDVYDLQYEEGFTGDSFRMRRPLYALTVSTDGVYNNWECLWYDKLTNRFKLVYTQAFAD